MNPFLHDIRQQPQALRRLADFYNQAEGMERLSAIRPSAHPILTGMGASFHAAWVATCHLHHLGIPALLSEATDLLFYGKPILRERSHLVFVSQSGASAEVGPILDALPVETRPVAVTNHPGSPLALRAGVVLPLLAGEETAVAAKTYVNSLATLWLLVRRWSDLYNGSETGTLMAVADEIDKLLAQSGTIQERWLDTLDRAETLLFVGHGPHAATARQAAMMVGEWARLPALHASVGAFRHGFIEVTRPGLGVVVFAAPGPAQASALALASQLQGYGARVLLVENGRTRHISEATATHLGGVAKAENGSAGIDEFLSPMLDVIPAQLYADALATHLGVAPGFRYISKVVTQL